MRLRGHLESQTEGPDPLPRPRSGRRWLLLAAAVAAILIGADRYLAYHRQVVVVNGFDQPITLVLAGQAPEAVGPQARAVLTLAEGTSDIKVEKPIHETVPVRIPSSFSERWLGGDDWFFNPGGAALLLYERLTQSNGTVHVETQLLYDTRFFGLPKIDFLFAPFPPNSRPERGTVWSRLDRIAAAEAVDVLLNRGEREPALRLIEWHLHGHPRETSLLMPYFGLSLGLGQQERARDFLEWGTTLRPLILQWHRFYQDVSFHLGAQAELVARYDGLLQQEPTNSALIYLRGRLCMYRHEALPYYERALREDPSNAFAHNGMAFLLASSGDWAAAVAQATRAVELQPEDPQMQELLFDSELAAGSLAEMEKQWRAAAAVRPPKLLPQMRFITVLAAQGRTNEIAAVVQQFTQAVAGAQDRPARQEIIQLEYHAAYARGDFRGLMNVVQQNLAFFGLLDQFETLVAGGFLEQIDKVTTPDRAPSMSPFNLLIVSMAWESAGQQERASAWRTEALKRLRQERPEYAVAAEMLEHPDQTALNDVLDLAIAPQSKAILLVALARGHPTQAALMRSTARRLNVRREFPFYWIERFSG